MRQQKKTTSGITASFPIAAVPRAGKILLDCLHGVEAMPTHSLPGLLRDTANEARRHDPHNSFAGRVQALLEKKLDHLKQFLTASGKAFFRGHTGLTKVARRFREGRREPGRESRFEPGQETGLCAAGPKSVDRQQALLDRIALLERQLADAETRIVHETDWVPLIKATAAPAAASVTASAPDCDVSECNARDGTQIGPCDDFDLAGRCVLCVGGRATLYSEYRRLIEASGGSLLIYRGGPQNGEEHLSPLLARADMVVCPVDCVNHHTYFTVKRYCKLSGKACVLLDRSALPTFRKGVEALAALDLPPAGGGKSAQSMNLRFA